ncbi:MAG TPA: hypothetical protein V6D46_06440, partial [Coleofasciculaceae cyanobacterium]
PSSTVYPLSLHESPDFSIVLGGPLYQLWRRSKLCGGVLELLHRRIIVFTLLGWVPPLLLSIAEGRAWGGSVKLPFFYDMAVQTRQLIAVPLFLLAELFIHQWMHPAVAQFLARGLIPDASRETFNGAIASALKLRNAIVPELLLIVLVYVIAPAWHNQLVPRDLVSWYGKSVDGKLHLTLAGWWAGYVALPLFQFLLLRWYFRLLIWARFLWQVSRIPLQLIPTHPDRCGGLSFLGIVGQAFAPLLLAQAAVMAGRIANRIFANGAQLLEFQVTLVGLVAAMVGLVVGPLLVFMPQLAIAKFVGLHEYGVLAQRYTREFDQKWLRGGAPADELLLGSGDIQSLTDLGSSYEIVTEMRWVPFTIVTLFQLVGITLTPVLPLFLTVIPLEELIRRLIQTVFLG